MTTRLSTLYEAFPLHCQRIAELTKDKTWLQRPAQGEDAGTILALAFDWRKTPEAQCYWLALALGSRQQHRRAA